jgi:hypothetical protein
MTRTARDLLDAAARARVPDDVDLLPRLSARLERPTFGQTLRARPALALLAGLLALALLSGVAYAVGRSLGYIPGLGLVESGAELRVLAAPVVVKRDGITLTVMQGLASPEKTVLTFRVENIPESALARDYAEGETPPPTCTPQDRLRLPDGTTLSPTGGQGTGWQLGFEVRDVFDPLPADANEATLLVPCLLDTAPGKAPDNWEVPLVFVPAPPDLTVVPVSEITPTAAPTVEGSTVPPATPAPAPITIERTIALDDGTILIGSFHSITAPDGLVTSPYVWYVRITDANGNDVPYDYASDIDLPAADEHTSSWAYKIQGKDHAWPITITVDSIDATLPDVQASFELDTGFSPQPGQEWAINRDLDLAGHPLRVLTATRNPDGYSFSFQGDGAITGVGVDIRGTAPHIAPAGGGGGSGGDGSLSAGVAYAGEIPEGRLTVLINSVTISEPGPWSIQWQPEGTAGQAAPTPTPGAAACVTDASWARALASVPASFPPGLQGRLILLGPNGNGTRYGVSVFGLADGIRQFIAEGSWPVVSPDGRKVVFTGDQGLEVYDVDIDQTVNLPGTDPTDYRMVWSPDGRQIAFIRSSSDEIMTIHADGTQPRTVRDNAAVYHALVGWADSSHLLITEPGPEGVTIQSLDLSSGATSDLFTISSNKADTVVSQDGRWIAFTNSLGGMSGNGLYTSRLDGSERRLVAAIEGRALYFPVWSPDGRWLILSLPDPNDPVDQARQALMELDTCKIIPLPDVGGDVYSWGRTESAP